MSNPLLLITHYKEHQKTIDSYLPYSIGIEIECSRKDNYMVEFFQKIPYMMEVNSDSGESRFRIPNGLRGLICLYLLSLTCKQQLELNPDSGIHYHCDLTDCYSKFKKEMTPSHNEYILSELDKWDYKGTYNPRKVVGECYASWARFQDTFKTIEIRIGEMTFEYELLLKRILHITEIVDTVASSMGIDRKVKYEPVNQDIVYNFLKNGVHIHDASVKNSIRGLLEEKNRLLRLIDKPVEQESFSKSKIVKLF
jgi:hypothetical protein